MQIQADMMHFQVKTAMWGSHHFWVMKPLQKYIIVSCISSGCSSGGSDEVITQLLSTPSQQLILFLLICVLVTIFIHNESCRSALYKPLFSLWPWSSILLVSY